MYILSQILAAIADFMFMLSALSKKKRWVIFFFIINDLLFAIHYAILHAYSGAFAIFVEGLFMFASYFFTGSGNRFRSLLYIIAQALLLLVAIFTFDGFVSLLPIIYMSICMLSISLNDVLFSKVGSIIRNVLCSIYLFLITSYVGGAIELCLLIFSIVGLVRCLKFKMK